MSSSDLSQYFEPAASTVSQEDDVAFEELLAHRYAEMESVLADMEAVEAQIEELEQLDPEQSLSQEQIMQIFDSARVDYPSLEAFDMATVSFEERAGGMSNFLSRIRDVHLQNFLRLADAISDMVKTSAKKVKKYQSRLLKIRNKYRGKSEAHQRGASHTASFVGIGLADFWFANGRVIRELFAQLQKEQQMIDYVLKKYKPAIGSEIDELSNLLTRAKLDNTENFQKSLLQPLEKKKAPLALFDGSYTGGSPYMGNQGLIPSGRYKPKLNHLQTLAQGRHVRLKKFSTADILPDVELTTEEVGQLIDSGLAFAALAQQFFEQEVEQMRQKNKAAAEQVSKSFTGIDEAVAKAHKKDIRLVSKYGRTLSVCYWKTSLDVARHAVNITQTLAYLSNRFVKVM